MSSMSHRYNPQSSQYDQRYQPYYNQQSSQYDQQYQQSSYNPWEAEEELESILPSYGAYELAGDLRATTQGFQLSGIEHDYYGLSDTDVELVYSDDENLEELGRWGRRGPPTDGPTAMPGGPAACPFFARRRRFLRRNQPMGCRQNRWRMEFLRRLTEGRTQMGADDMAALSDVDAALVTAASNGGVDFGRVRPRRPWSEGPLVFGIAIRKRPTDEYGAILRYDSRSAAKILRDATATSDWTAGSRARFPQGDDAPLPPPRRVGEEVHGG
jgi:hypothetical protein